MAAIDTIVILNGLMHAKDNTDDVWTLDGDGENYEAVKTYPFTIGADASAVLVIFNGAYDPDGGRCHVRVKSTKITDHTTAPPTKTYAQHLEWTIVTPPAVSDIEIDFTDCIGGKLHIDVALSSITASTGLEIIVQEKCESGIDEWTTIGRWVGPTGTGQKADFDGDEAAGQTTLSVANPTAADLNHIGKFIFLEDTAAIANCEIAFLVECGADA